MLTFSFYLLSALGYLYQFIANVKWQWEIRYNDKLTDAAK